VTFWQDNGASPERVADVAIGQLGRDRPFMFRVPYVGTPQDCADNIDLIVSGAGRTANLKSSLIVAYAIGSQKQDGTTWVYFVATPQQGEWSGQTWALAS
jgi:hypothetical protein